MCSRPCREARWTGVATVRLLTGAVALAITAIDLVVAAVVLAMAAVIVEVLSLVRACSGLRAILKSLSPPIGC